MASPVGEAAVRRRARHRLRRARKKRERTLAGWLKSMSCSIQPKSLSRSAALEPTLETGSGSASGASQGERRPGIRGCRGTGWWKHWPGGGAPVEHRDVFGGRCRRRRRLRGELEMRFNDVGDVDQQGRQRAAAGYLPPRGRARLVVPRPHRPRRRSVRSRSWRRPRCGGRTGSGSVLSTWIRSTVQRIPGFQWIASTMPRAAEGVITS